MTITGLVNSSTVKIYSISGRLIKTIDGTLLGSTVTWDGKDENGKDLASGVYLVSATSALAEESGQTKFVLVRKK
jgi:flagellar hook assembly protein FlgD